MKFTNKSIHSDEFLKRAMRWACRILEFPISEIRAASFGHRNDGWRGRANYKNMSIYVRTDLAQNYPTRSFYNATSKRAEPFFFTDSIEVLVNLIAHEIAHLQHHVQRTKGVTIRRCGSEGDIDAIGNWAVVQFHKNRKQLMAEWQSETSMRSAATGG